MSSEQTVPVRRRMVFIAVGTRPEAIKMLPLASAMLQNPHMDPIVIATGQHPGIVKELFSQYDIPVQVDLQVGRPGITLNEMFADIEIGRASCRDRRET